MKTELEAAAAPLRAVQSQELEHLGALAERTRIAFEVARDAFLLLETAHWEGRPGTDENATFRAKVALFREAAAAVHHAARVVREASIRRRDETEVGVLAPGTGIERRRPARQTGLQAS